jgi:hypothetical protein
MSTEARAVTPVRADWKLWVVGIVALLWNGMGALDYVMTQTRNAAYMQQFTPEQLEYFYSFPAWVVALWAIAVWGGVLGSVLLLLRRRLAEHVFLVSFVAMVITTIHNFVLTDGMAKMGGGAAAFSAVIFGVALGLYLYSRHLARRGVLT